MQVWLKKALREYILQYSLYYYDWILFPLFLLSLFLCPSFFIQDPKGDESRMLSLRLSGRPQERVRQESSEWPHLLLQSILQSRTQSCPSGSKVVIVFSLFSLWGTFHIVVWTQKKPRSRIYLLILTSILYIDLIIDDKSEILLYLWSWGSGVTTSACCFSFFKVQFSLSYAS